MIPIRKVNFIYSTTLITAFFLFNGCNNGNTDFIFPETNKGWAVYIANDSKGHKLKYDKGRAIVKFPENGIFFSQSPIPKGRNNGFYTVKNGQRIKLSLMLETQNDSMKLCNIIPSGLGFSVNSFKEEIGIKPLSKDTFINYELLYFNINNECEASEEFDSFQNKVKKVLISRIENGG